MGHARALLALEGEAQIDAALVSVNKKLTVRQTEALVKKMLTPAVEKPPVVVSPELANVQDRLAEKLGTKVSLSQGKSGNGKLVINFDQHEKLMQILAMLGEEM